MWTPAGTRLKLPPPLSFAMNPMMSVLVKCQRYGCWLTPWKFVPALRSIARAARIPAAARSRRRRSWHKPVSAGPDGGHPQHESGDSGNPEPRIAQHGRALLVVHRDGQAVVHGFSAAGGLDAGAGVGRGAGLTALHASIGV